MPDRLLARLARSAGYVLTGNAPADWFGPQQPLPPQAPQDVAGRQFDYPFGFNLAVTPRSQERTGFDALRGLADSYDLLRAVIETRKDQMERLSWRIRPRALAQTGRASDPRLSALTQFFHCPDRRHGWAPWLRMLLEDLLVIDAPTLYKRRTRGGALYALEVIDGATIKRLIDDWGRTPVPPAPAYQQILKGVPAVDYAADELIYAPRNPRVHKAYGFSPVEQVQMSVNIALRRQIYQLQYYTEGNVPEALIGVPENWNPDQIRQFQAYWDGLNSGDTAERRHAKFVPGGVAKTFVPVREPAMKDAFDEWLARVVCYVFSVPPSAFTGQVNRATADTAQDVALSEGMAPLQRWVKHLLDRVIAEDFAAPDLEFAWDQDKDTDAAQTASIASDYVKTGIKSINEIRAELGLPPVKGGEVPKIQTAQGLMPLTQAASVTPTPAAKALGEKLERSNPNHFGPGDRGGQFAPASEGGSDGANPVRPVVYRPGNGHSEGSDDPIVPVQDEITPSVGVPVPGTVGGQLPRWFRGLRPIEPGTSPTGGAVPPSPEPPSTPSPKAPSMSGEPGAAPGEPKSLPSEEAPPGIGHNSPPTDEAMSPAAQKPTPPDKPYELPAPTSRSDSYKAGTDVATRLKEAINNGWNDVAQQITDVADAAHRVKNQISNIIADVDFGLGGPYDLQTLIDNTKAPSQPGYEDHHIVPAQRGTEDKGLSPEDEKRLESDENFVRIPKYVHQRITNYYREPIKGPPFKGRSPIDYLQDKTFDERYQFGLRVLREFGAIK